MFSATLSQEIRSVCKKFMLNPIEFYIGGAINLTLHGLQQHYVQLKENEKNNKLFEPLDVLEFNQVVISTADRTELSCGGHTSWHVAGEAKSNTLVIKSSRIFESAY